MHIAIDIRHLATDQHSGIGRYTIEIVRRMTKCAPHDFFTLFAAGTPETLEKLPLFSGKNVQVVEEKTPNRLLSAKLYFTAHTLEDFLPTKPDVWFFPNINIIKTHRPYALTVHDLSFEVFPHFFRLKDRAWHRASAPEQLAKLANHLFAVSEHTKHHTSALWSIDPDQITVTPLGIDPDFCANEQPCDKNYLRLHNIDYPYILSLCTREPRKNIETIVEAYEAWRTSHFPLPKGEQKGVADDPSPHLVIAGGRGWKNDYLHKRIRTSPYKNNIHVLGYVPEKHKPSLYRHAQLFVFPSFFEGFGLPIIEALSCGTPVITSFTGSMPEVGKERVIYVDPYNVNDLTRAIKIGLSREKRTSPQVYSDFSWDTAAEKTLEKLHELIYTQ